MADSSPIEADPKDVLLAAGAMGAVGIVAMLMDGGFQIGLIVLGLAALMFLMAGWQWKRAA